jgi:hypothetical protein
MKWWKNRMSTKLKIGVVCNWTGTTGLPMSSEYTCSNDGALAAGYLHTSSFFMQLSHAGSVSWHFKSDQHSLARDLMIKLTLIFRLLQLKQPCLDFL